MVCLRDGAFVDAGPVRWGVRFVGGLAVVLALARAAHAAPPDRGADADALVRLGDRARLDGRFEEAEASYRAALSLRSEDAIALRLALSLASQGRALEAAPLLARLGASEALDADGRAEASGALADARKAIATFEIHATERGAAIDADGATVGTAPLAGPVFLGPGAHTLSAKLAGFLPAVATIDAQKGRSYVVTLEMQPDPAPILRWTSHARAGRAGPPEEPSFDAYFLPPGGPVRALGIGIAITLGFGGATALGIASENDRLVADYKRGVKAQGGPSCFDTKPPADLDCQRLAQSMAVSRTAGDAGAVLLAGAGAGAAIALLSFFVLPPPADRAGRADDRHPILTLTPSAGSTFGGLSLEATW